jgi:signal transduction histidine kinase
MAERILVVDSGRRRALLWKTRLSPSVGQIIGPFSSPTRIRPDDLGAVDLIIMDGASLEAGGIELISALRKRAESTHPLLIVLTAPRDLAHRAHAIAAGADEVLEESVDAQSLELCVKYLLRLKAAKDELLRGARASARARDEQRMLADSLIHDLKNPIAVVHVNLAWALERLGAEWPEVAEALADAQGGLTSLRQLVDDLLMAGMLEQAKVPLKREAVDVNELLEEAVKSHAGEARARNVSLTVSLEKDMQVVGDTATLKRAFHNVVETSLRNTPSSGKIALSASLAPEAPATDGKIEIAVSSSGRPRESARRPSSAPRLPSGSLALYFCRRAVEANAGEFDVVESDEGPSSVVMRFPATG